MPGIYELAIALTPIAVGAAIIVAAVLRLRKKLAAEAKPTLGTYFNEIGGYVVVAIVALGIGAFLLVSGDLATEGSGEQSPSTNGTNEAQPGSSAEVEPAVDEKPRNQVPMDNPAPTRFNMSLEELSEPVPAGDSSGRQPDDERGE